MLRSWIPVHEQILPHEYAVKWQNREGKLYSLREDETGVSLQVEGTKTYLTGNPLHLPDFKDAAHGHVLRVLLHETLINIVDGKPLTNLFVQTSPSVRDAAIICECLRRTDNLFLVKDWILGMGQSIDFHDVKAIEPDNLGQALFLLSLVSDKRHPLIADILNCAKRYRRTDYIAGLTEAAEHPVYQTKWLKFGLKNLGLEDSFNIPVAFDSYSPVFWLDYRDIPTNGPGFPEKTKEASPHLAWAEAHFHGWDPPMSLSSKNYPLSWEMTGEDQKPLGMNVLSREWVERGIVSPHARHAAEMLLYFLDMAARGPQAHKDQGVLQAH